MYKCTFIFKSKICLIGLICEWVGVLPLPRLVVFIACKFAVVYHFAFISTFWIACTFVHFYLKIFTYIYSYSEKLKGISVVQNTESIHLEGIHFNFSPLLSKFNYLPFGSWQIKIIVIKDALWKGHKAL